SGVTSNFAGWSPSPTDRLAATSIEEGGVSRHPGGVRYFRRARRRGGAWGEVFGAAGRSTPGPRMSMKSLSTPPTLRLLATLPRKRPLSGPRPRSTRRQRSTLGLSWPPAAGSLLRMISGLPTPSGLRVATRLGLPLSSFHLSGVFQVNDGSALGLTSIESSSLRYVGSTRPTMSSRPTSLKNQTSSPAGAMAAGRRTRPGPPSSGGRGG